MIPTILRLIGALVLIASTTLPLGTCTQQLATGETATGVLRHTLDLDTISDPDSWPTVMAYLWPLIVLPLFLIVRTARIRVGLRVAEVLLLIYSAFALGTILSIGRPAFGFYVGAAGILAYAIGVMYGIPPPRMQRAA